MSTDFLFRKILNLIFGFESFARCGAKIEVEEFQQPPLDMVADTLVTLIADVPPVFDEYVPSALHDLEVLHGSYVAVQQLHDLLKETEVED